MPKYKIFAGLAGGFGGAVEQYTIECENKEQAEDIAYQEACDYFDNQLGTGMEGWEDFMEEARGEIFEDEFDTDEEYERALEDYATQMESDARESLIDYYVEEVFDDDLSDDN